MSRAVSRRPSKVLPAQAWNTRLRASSGTIGTDCSWHDGPLDLGHRVGRDLLFLGQPAIQDLEDLVVGGGGAGLAAGEQVAQERLQVAARGRLQAGSMLAQEGVGLPDRDEIRW
jgi:hypothetical protein